MSTIFRIEDSVNENFAEATLALVNRLGVDPVFNPYLAIMPFSIPSAARLVHMLVQVVFLSAR